MTRIERHLRRISAATDHSSASCRRDSEPRPCLILGVIAPPWYGQRAAYGTIERVTSNPYSAWTVIVPAKAADRAKTRLSATYGAWRPYVARAFALDTIRAACDCVRVDQVMVVTDDDALVRTIDGWPRVRTVRDPGDDLNGAIRAGARVAPAGERIAVLPADLPALTGAELAAALERAEGHDQSVVADGEGIGTTLLTARTPAQLSPAYGPDSLQAHRVAGATVLDLADASSLRRDVDLPSHLTEAARIGIGPSTRRVLERVRKREETGPTGDPVSSR